MGHGHRFNSDVPRLVHALNGIRVVSVACGSHHTVVLDGMSFVYLSLFFLTLFAENGYVYTCGLGVFGQLGHGNLRDQLNPERVEHLVNIGVVVQIACGAYHTVCRTGVFIFITTLFLLTTILAKGELYSFGHGEYGQHGGVANYADWGSGEQV